MKQSILRTTVFAVTVALLFIGCDDSASPKWSGQVDGFLDRVNAKPGAGSGTDDKRDVTVFSNGSGAFGGGTYVVGTTVLISAGTVSGGRFEKWVAESKGVFFADSSNATTSFTMPPNDVKVTAVFLYSVAVSSVLTGATGGGYYMPGTKVNITSGTMDEQWFVKWTTASNDVTFADSSKESTSFTMPTHGVTVTAVFVSNDLYPVMVLSAGNGATGGGRYLSGGRVNITAGTMPTDYDAFKTWAASYSNVVFADPNSTATTFIMPSAAVRVTAVFVASDSKTYKTVKIGNQTWMAENLNYKTSSGSWCLNNADSNCVKYGRLYDWGTARVVCPNGWHLPSSGEWGILVKTIGNNAGTKLKATSGWGNYNGTDDYGFAALPSGHYQYYDDFETMDGRNGSFMSGNSYWWTNTEDIDDYSPYNAESRSISGSEIGYGAGTYKLFGYSVRCVMDD